MSITGLEMAGADSAHRSAPGQQRWEVRDHSRSGAPHGDASPASCQTQARNPNRRPEPLPPSSRLSFISLLGSCGPWRRAGYSLPLQGPRGCPLSTLSAWGSPNSKRYVGKGQKGKLEKNGPMAGRNLLTGRCTEGRSEKEGPGRAWRMCQAATEAEVGAGSHALGPVWPGALRYFLSSPRLSVSSRESSQGLGTRCFRNRLSLDSTQAGQALSATRLAEEGQLSDTFLSSSCVSLHLSLCK